MRTAYLFPWLAAMVLNLPAAGGADEMAPFVLPEVGGPASTRMACPPDEEKAEAFVQVRGGGHLQPFNSRLPIVTYVPEGFSVGYRSWVARQIGWSINMPLTLALLRRALGLS